jgi:bacillithiol system protein YtxJ
MTRLNSLADWENLIEKSKAEPVVIFKHSNTCPVSITALKRLLGAVHAGVLFKPVYLVVVQENREISDHIEQDLNIKHESPQVIIMSHGHGKYNASHGSINPEEVIRELENIS